MIKLLKKLFGIEDYLMYMMNGASALPDKLNPNEEYDVLLKIKNGDDDARGILIERNLRLVVYLAQRFENTGANLDDLTSIGTIGLIRPSEHLIWIKTLSLLHMHLDVLKMKS